MKHTYAAACTCERCTRERIRRERQADQNAARRRPQTIRTSRGRRSITCNEAPIDRWAKAYYDSEGAIDQFNPEDR